MTDPHTIAAGLTKAQREALLHGVYFEERWGGRYRIRAHGKVKWNLCIAGLLRDYIGCPTLSPEGLAVRSALIEQEKQS